MMYLYSSLMLLLILHTAISGDRNSVRFAHVINREGSGFFPQQVDENRGALEVYHIKNILYELLSIYCSVFLQSDFSHIVPYAPSKRWSKANRASLISKTL